jgi:hypothetical protein
VLGAVVAPRSACAFAGHSRESGNLVFSLA